MAKISKAIKENIERGKILSANIKRMETELDGIKSILKAELGEGTYIGTNDAVAIIGEKIGYVPPSPKTVLQKLKAIKKEIMFTDCVKIMVEATRKILGEAVYDEIKGKKTTTTSISFK